MTSTRYVLELAYNGTRYAGWQRQPNALSVEQTVDTALSRLLNDTVRIVGCGRTDAGVHASYYVAHFDYAGDFPPAFLRRYNRYVADHVALLGVHRVAPDFHARFNATGRAYTYRISLTKDPFRQQTVTPLPLHQRYDRALMRAAADLLPQYNAFAPFCKTKSDVFTMACDLTEARWEFGPQEWVFYVAANRFLRGMVRLIVGMCLRVGEGKMSLDDVRRALNRQERLPAPTSAPATGLFLSGVSYPDRSGWERLF